MNLRHSLLLLLLPLACLGQSFDGHSLTGTNIDLSGQTGWSVDSGNDSPEGCYYHGNTGVSNSTVSILLPTTCAAGVWRFQLKAIDYDKYHLATFRLADATSAAQALSDRDDSNSRWLSAGVNITNTLSTNKLWIDFATTNNGNMQLRLLALYYTTNVNEDIDTGGKDLVWNYTYPSSVSTTVDNTNNVLATSGFEAGLGGWRPSANLRPDALSTFLVSGGAQSGDWSLKIPSNSLAMVSPYFLPKDDSRNYTISLYYKGTGGVVRVHAAVTAPSGFSNTTDQSWSLTSSTGWIRTNWSLALRSYPSRVPFTVDLSTTTIGEQFDSVMVHEGTNAAPFVTMGNLEVGWSNSTASGVYYTNEASKPYIVAFNTSGTTRSVTIYYEFVNHFLSTVLSGSVTASLTNGGRLVSAITLPTNPGWYRAVCWSDGVEPAESAIVCMPDPGSSQNDFVGTHPYPNVWQMQGVERLGISHARAMSPNAMFRWTQAEATDNVFTYYDYLITNSLNNNAVTLATIGMHGGTTVPSYAGGTVAAMDNDQWSNHVYTIVSHYKYAITNWEIWNELSQANGTYGQYTNILKLASQAAKAADVNAKIMGLGGPGDQTWATNVLFSFGSSLTNYIDSISIHGYPVGTDPHSSGPALSQASGWKTVVLDRYGPGTSFGLPVNNTESGIWCWGGALGNLRRYITLGAGIYTYGHQRPDFEGYMQAPWQITQHALAYKVYGFQRYYYYDSRHNNDSLWVDNWPMSWEGDDGHRPKMAAIAAVNYIVAGTTAGGLLQSRSNNVVFLYFENGNNSRCAVWTTNANFYTMTVTNIVPYDFMLAPKTVTANQFTIGRMPTYLLPSGLSSAQFQQNLTNAGYVATADTVAPNVCISIFPGATIVDTNRVLLRWALVDEVSLPGKNNQTDLLTRSALIANTSTINDTNYDTWSTSVQRIFSNVSTPNSTLYVQGKDAAGNVATVYRVFGAPAPAIVHVNARGKRFLASPQ